MLRESLVNFIKIQVLELYLFIKNLIIEFWVFKLLLTGIILVLLDGKSLKINK